MMNMKDKVKWTLYIGTSILLGGLMTAVTLTHQAAYEETSNGMSYGSYKSFAAFSSVPDAYPSQTFRRSYEYADDDDYEHDDDHHTYGDDRHAYDDDEHDDTYKYKNSTVLTDPVGSPSRTNETRLQDTTQTTPNMQTTQTTRKVRTRLS